MKRTSTILSHKIGNMSLATVAMGFRYIKAIALLIVLWLCSLQVNANWYTDHAQKFFKASFNVNNGSIHVETFVHNGSVFGCCGVDRTWELTASNTKLYYTTDNQNYILFYEYNYDYSQLTSQNTFGNSISSYHDVPDTRNRIRFTDFYLPDFANIVNIRMDVILTRGGGAQGGPEYTSESKPVTVTQMSDILVTPYKFVMSSNVAQAEIGFSKPFLNAVDNKSKMFLVDASFNPNRVVATFPAPISNSGAANVDLSNSSKSYYFQQNAYDERWKLNSGFIKVPAFTFPLTATATYDAITQKAKFTWTIDPVASADVVTSDFKIQIADNANFTGAQEYKYTYDKNKSSYEFFLDKNFSPTLYFRVARDYVGFNWELAKSASITIPFTALPPTSSVVLLDKAAVINWSPSATAWISGSSFIIKRINNTAKTEGEIRLTKADFDKGTYTDNQIAICNSYNYTLQVVPASGSGFEAYPAVRVLDTILPIEIGTILNLEVSKGYFPERTELRWSSTGVFDNFVIKRAIYGTNNFLQIASVPGSSTSDYQTDDTKGTPGVYYTYQVIGAIKCNNANVFSKDTLSSIGFRSPTGNIYGRITYENGQAVDDAEVRLQSNDQTQQAKSIYLNGTPNSFLQLDSTTAPFSDSTFTIEAWIKPDVSNPVNQTIFSRNNQYALGFDNAGKLFFKHKDATVTGTYSNSNNTFVHVTGIRTKDSLFVMLDGSIVGRSGVAYSQSTPDKKVYIGKGEANEMFKGYIDEMRLYNIAVPLPEVNKNMTRLLAGKETGLAAYWRFDETITNQFYDVSYRGEDYNRNDGKMNASAVIRSSTIPTADQLALKSYTDLTGNYFITGIPYMGNGTTYTIAPRKGTHQFDPQSVNRLLSAASPQFTVDFKDKSSFPLSGIVYFDNTTVPVPGVQFKIDGQFAQQSNGEVIQTDSYGKFEISVPVGVHEVRAVKLNHVFKKDGKLTDANGRNYNFQQAFSGAEFLDSTTIRFIGRVAGGAVQANQPLGHSVSVNNLGKTLSVALTFPTSQGYNLNIGNKSPKEVKHPLPTSVNAANEPRKTIVTNNESSIIITPDPLTGEFIADIIPIKFQATATATGWETINNNPILLDFEDKFTLQSSVRTYVDSALNNQNIYVKTNYRDSLIYNDAFQFIKRQQPQIEVLQKNGSKTDPYFGDMFFVSTNLGGARDSVRAVDTTLAGKQRYIFGNPIFLQKKPYTFSVQAFEEYPFYSSVDGNGIKTISSRDRVPTSDGLVSVLNNLRNGSSFPDTFSLNEKGMAEYKFVGGDPNLASAGGLKNLSTSIRFGEAEVINWNWYGNQQLSAFVMGSKLTGTDFVTAGPDNVLMVLRDPPGATSSSYVEKGSTISNITKYSGSADGAGSLDIKTTLGYKAITYTGLGVGVITEVEATTGAEIGIKHEEQFTGSDSKEITETLTTKFQTSDNPLFVGPIADVFVGYSSNITYGVSNNITIIKKDDFTSTDVSIVNLPNSDHMLIQRSGISIGEKFKTLFAFPQQHLVKILIPNLTFLRNTLLKPKNFSIAQAQYVADSSNKPVYISKLEKTDQNFGRPNSDTLAFGSAAKLAPVGDGPSYRIIYPRSVFVPEDSLLALNQYIDNWKARMADNEKDKIESIFRENYSFQAGSPVSYVENKSIKQTQEKAWKFVLAGSVINSTNVDINKNGVEFKYTQSIGTTQTGSIGNEVTSTTEMGFTLSSNGTDDNFTMDLRKAADNSFVFHTKGGASACPYVGATISQYYKPGTVIDQPTQRIEVPVLLVDKPVATNVPSSRKAVYNLTLKNESEAKLPATFLIGYSDLDSIYGATIAIDGTPIGGTGRAVNIQYGESITKVLTLTKGPNVNDYENIPILLKSACQYDINGYLELIADTVLISAHFIPSCSDINIKSPKDKWVVNTVSPPFPLSGNKYLPITIDQFDVTNSLFDHIELQYKPASSSTWISAMSFYPESKYVAGQGREKIINPEAINYKFVMDNGSFSDQAYDIQAVSVCKIGNDSITTESNLIAGIKDTYIPRLFGTPQPANGILGVNDVVRLNFNEPIAAGLLQDADFSVTGIRNGVKGNHSVSAKLDGIGNHLATEFEKSFTGKSITAEAWILPNGLANQTIFSHGDVNESLELALTADRKIKVTVGNNTIISTDTFAYKPGEWAHVAMVYNDNARTVSAFYNYTSVIPAAAVNPYTGTGIIEYGRSVRKKDSYFAGSIHEARIWNDTLNSFKLQQNSLSMLSGTENTLLAYYPMSEGRGEVAFDKAHGSHATLNGLWSTPRSNAVSLNGSGYVKASTSAAVITQDMDYTMELWFKADATQTDATLASNGKGDGTDPETSFKLFNLGFEGGLLTYRNNGFAVIAEGNYLDNKWHHVAIAINRNAASGQLLVDGKLNQYFDSKSLGSIESAFTYLGTRAYYTETSPTVPLFDRRLKGNVDEFRLWNTYLDETLVSMNNNVRLQGDEIGLMAYYPMDEDKTEQGLTQRYFSLKDAKKDNFVVADATMVNGVESIDAAPIKNRGPVEKLKFDFVVNNDAMIINVLEPKQYIDKTIITFRASNIRDLNGNKIGSPVTWTAYIDQNQLKWSDREIELVKEVNQPMTFESHLVNSGGTAQRFYLSNLPSWLKASAMNGTVDPKGNVKIVFTINEALNIGSYEEIIFMRNDKDETEALKITLKVKGKKPNWVVNAADYQYNMGVYGKIRLNNVFSINKEDMLAAFINGKCVGVANNTYNTSSNFWYTVLTIFSNDVANANVEFRIWQASTGKTYQAIPSKAVPFANNTVIGTPAIPVIFDGTTLAFKDMIVNKNWNWISFNLSIPTGTDLNATLINGIWSEEDLIKDDIKSFATYKLNDGWKGSLKTLDNLSLYKLTTATAQSLIVSGTPVNVANTYIPLKGARWNYISYLPQLNATLKEALAGYKPADEDVIKSQTGFAMYSTQSGWVGSLNFLEPGKGYMFYRKRATDTTFRYPVINGSLSGGRISTQAVNLNPDQRPVASNFSNADNMTVIAKISSDFDFKYGDSVVAYVNGEVRGKAKPIFNTEINANTYFFNIGGEAEQSLVFTIERGGSIVAQSSTIINYRSNLSIGTLAKPLELQFVKGPAAIVVYPNPFTNLTKINVDLRGMSNSLDHEIQWSVVDASGRTIYTTAMQKVSGTGYTTTWNGTNDQGISCAKGIYFIRLLLNGIPHLQRVIKQ